MRQKDLTDILENKDLSTAEKAAKIQALNGIDVNAAKDLVKEEYQASQTEIEELKNKNKDLKASLDSYKDYDELKKFKEDILAKEDKQRKIEFLKSDAVKAKSNYIDLLLDKIDWSKGKYDEEKKTFTGLEADINDSKTIYADLFESENKSASFAFSGADSNGGVAKPDNADTLMNNLITEALGGK